LALTTLSVFGYRSLRDIVLELAPLTVVTGANGSGKSNLYRALRLLADVAHDRLIGSLAAEGGLPSTLWAGPERFSRAMERGETAVQGTVRKASVSLKLGFGSDDFGYAVDCGLPVGGHGAFALDPVIKRECVWAGPVLRPATLLVDRIGPSVRLRQGPGNGSSQASRGRRAPPSLSPWRTLPEAIAPFDSVVSHPIDPRAAPELVVLRERLRRWRFYDQLRSDRDCPARQPRIGTLTTALADDGGDLAAAVQTIREIGDHEAFDAAITDAFPGATVAIEVQDGRFALRFSQPGLLRPLAGAELSDGTLRYLLWVAALLSPRPPELLALNEPETSLHPDLLPALGRCITAAARASQVIVVTHSTRLAAALDEAPECRHLVLQKRLGETRCSTGQWVGLTAGEADDAAAGVDDDADDTVDTAADGDDTGRAAGDRPAWVWPQRR
jgi:predicted ATPase